MNNDLLYRLSSVSFAKWDLHLYLDTHPYDEKAIDLYRQYSQKEEQLRKEYENMYGSLSSSTAIGEKWTKSPWPWERKGCER